MATPREIAVAAEKRDIRNRWLLSSPALIIIALAAIGPLFVVLLYSFMAQGRLWRREVRAIFARWLVRRILAAVTSLTTR